MVSKFFWCSIIGGFDLLLLLVFVTLLVGVVQGFIKSICTAYFQEYEKFMQRMAGKHIPVIPSEMMH